MSGERLHIRAAIMFAASGCAALIYEVVWMQLLELIVGATAVSIAVLLGTFMGGMCIGSLAVHRAVGPNRNAMRVYAAVEVLTGLFGIAVLFGLPLLEKMMLPRALLAAVCLLPPTILMGATLPLIARFVDERRLGFLYGANIAGGVIGCIGAGFWLLRVYDMEIATYAAAALNLFAAAVAVSASRAERPLAAPVEIRGRDAGACAAIAFSGFAALGAEAIWTRLLSLTLGPTVYTFSIVLAVFLIGMGIGAAIGSTVGLRPRSALGFTQMLSIGAIAWGAYMIAQRLPYWDKNLSVHANPWTGFLFDFGCCALAVLPAAVLWGASFPLALRANGGARDSVRSAGEVYAFNTAGAIAGAVAMSVAAIPAIGSQNAERLLIAAAALGAVAVFARQRGNGAVIAAAIAAAVVCGAFISPVPWQLLAFGRRLPIETGRTGNGWKRLYSVEGINSSIAYTQFVDRFRYFHVAGKIEASSTPADMKVQRVLGHLPALLHAAPRSVLVVGCGAGVTAGSFVVHPETSRITLCEIEPKIPPATARYFARENNNVVYDPRTRIVYDDARHFVLTAKEKFDIITSDPIHPWVKGAATLYSKEYFEACRAHLRAGGLVTQWVPLYESDLAAVQSEIATFFGVFPEGIVWGNPGDLNQGYDVVLMGGLEPIRIDVNRVQNRIDASPPLKASLSEVGFHSAAELLGTYAASARDLRQWLAHAQINRDRSLRLQYLAGMALNQGRAAGIYAQIAQLGAFPPKLFTGSTEKIAAVRASFDGWRTEPF